MCVFFRPKPQKTGVSEQKLLYSGTLLSSLTQAYLSSLTLTRHVDMTLQPCVNSGEKGMSVGNMLVEGECVKSFCGPICCIIVTFNQACIGKKKKKIAQQIASLQMHK